MDYKFKKILIGQHVILKKTEIEDAQFIFNLRTSKAGRFLRQPKGYNLENQIMWMNSRPNNEINYIIIAKSTNEKVGTVSIYDVNFQDGIANVGRLILDEKYLKQSNPYGLESIFLTYDFVFNNLNLRKISGDILATNTEMVKFQLFLGMEQEGFLKEHILIQDQYVGLHLMSLFKHNFSSFYSKKILFLLKEFSK
jgi:RimJ/RimL family protein N-acetyltransferase